MTRSLELWTEGALTATFGVAWNEATPPEVEFVELSHPGSGSRTTFTVLERQVPGALPACADALELCAKLDGFLESARITAASFRHPDPPEAEVQPERRDCDLFDSDVIVVSERSHEEFAPKWGAAYLLDLARACDRDMDCLFVEEPVCDDCATSRRPTLHPALTRAADAAGARIVGVDVDRSITLDLLDRRRNATPATVYQAQRELIVDRNAFMAAQMIHSDCANGILMVGGAHVAHPLFDPGVSIPGLLTAAGWSVSVFDARCVPPAADLGWRGAQPIVRLTRVAPETVPPERFAVGTLEAECKVVH